MAMGMGIGLFANLLTQAISSGEKNQLAGEQKTKAAQLERQANEITPADPTKDPAYKMKAFLAAAGVPGYEQYKLGYEQSEQNALATAEKVAPSGGSLLETLGALESSKNRELTQLDAKNAAYIDAKKIDLADTRYSEQEHFNEIARNEKAKLNYAATQYENAAAEQHQAAQDQQTGALGSTGSGISSLFSSLMGNKGTGQIPTFGSGGTDMSSIASLMAALD